MLSISTLITILFSMFYVADANPIVGKPRIHNFMDTRWSILRRKKTFPLGEKRPAKLFQRSEIFVVHSQAAPMGLHQNIEGKGTECLFS